MQRKQDLNKIIEEEINKELDSGEVEKEVRELTDKEIRQEIAVEIDRRVKQRLHEEIPTETPITEQPKVFVSTFGLCWKTACKRIFLVMIFSYLLIIGIASFCALFPVSICTAAGVFSTGTYIIAISLISLLTVFFLALFSSQIQASLFFAFLVGLPMIILISALTFRYIGFILIALVILVRLVQGGRR